MQSEVERLKAQRKLRKRQLRLKQVREQESAVARHQAVVVNRRLKEIKEQKAYLKAAAMMEVAMGYSDQLNSALLQLGTGHEHAFEAAEQQKVIVQRHAERSERLAAKAEYRGSEALKIEQQARTRQLENRLQAEQKEAVRYHYMAKERKNARKFAEMALERQLVRDQYIVPEEPVNWNVTRVHDDRRRVVQGAEALADRTHAVAHARVIRHANVREDSAAVFNEAEENERKAKRRMAQREADMQRAAAAAEARGAEAQRKIDQDKDILLVEEELARLDALDRARRKVGRSENKLMFSSARATASRDAQLAEREFEASFMREMPLPRRSAVPQPEPQPQAAPAPQWEPVDDQRARSEQQRRRASQASQSSATTAVPSAPTWVELKPPRPRTRGEHASRRVDGGIVPAPWQFEMQAETARTPSSGTATTLSPRFGAEDRIMELQPQRPRQEGRWKHLTAPAPNVSPLPQAERQSQQTSFATYPPAMASTTRSDARFSRQSPSESASPEFSPMPSQKSTSEDEDEELRVSDQYIISRYLQQQPVLNDRSVSSPLSSGDVESVHEVDNEEDVDLSPSGPSAANVLFGERISRQSSSDTGFGSTERKSDEFSPGRSTRTRTHTTITTTTDYGHSGSDTDALLTASFRHANDIATDFLLGASERKADESTDTSASDESISDHLAASRDEQSRGSSVGAHESGSERERTGSRVEDPSHDHTSSSRSSTSQSQPHRESSSGTSSVHSPKSGKTTPPFHRTAPGVHPRAAGVEARTFWGAESGASGSASSAQLYFPANGSEQQLRPTPASSAEGMLSTVVEQARRAVQDIADQIRALEGVGATPGDVSVATSTKSSRYSVYVGGQVPEEAYASQQSEHRFGYYGENVTASSSVPMHSYISSDHSLQELGVSRNGEDHNQQDTQDDAISELSLESVQESGPGRVPAIVHDTGKDSHSGGSSASTAPARHDAHASRQSLDRSVESLKRDASRSPFSQLQRRVQAEDDRVSDVPSSLSLTSLTQESFTMTPSHVSHQTEPFAPVFSLPSQSFAAAEELTALSQEEDQDGSDSDADLQEQSLETATPPKDKDSEESLSQHDLTHSRVSSSFGASAAGQPRSESRSKLPYDPKWDELATMRKALADIQSRVARVPFTSPQSSDDSVQSSPGQQFVAPSPAQTPAASESDLALQSLYTPYSSHRRDTRTSTAPSTTSSELQFQHLTGTPMASVLEQLTASEMASVQEVDTIVSGSDDSIEELQIFDGVVMRIQEQLRGTASKIADLRQQHANSDSDASVSGVDQQRQSQNQQDGSSDSLNSGAEGDPAAEAHDGDSLEQSFLQSDSLSEYRLPSESARTDDVDNPARTLTQTSYSTQYDLSQFPYSTPVDTRSTRSSSF